MSEQGLTGNSKSVALKNNPIAMIKYYHAHVYYDQASLDQAHWLYDQIPKHFDVPMGHFHKKPVGPHPCWSFQVTVGVEQFGEIIPWLALNRQGLVVFVHPETGDDLSDHRDRAIWLGSSKTLDLSIFAP